LTELNINRRELLGIAAGTAALLAASTVRAEESTTKSLAVVDTNVSLFHWPFRRLPLDETAVLVKKFRALGITKAWAGSFEGLFHRDLAGVNRRLSEECKRHPELVPFGSININLPDWEHDFKQCLETHNMPGVRLHPNYHGYALDDSRFAGLLELAAKAGCLVQIAVALEDVRTQPEKLVVPDVDLSPLADAMSRVPKANVQLLNYRPQPAMMPKLAAVPNLHFDVARVEGTDGVPKLVELASKERVLFGSHAPFLIPEAAMIRVHESSLLDEPALRAVFSDNALALVGAQRR
jgi:predicted TIM-barrel fold metal-dependent hydrolase